MHRLSITYKLTLLLALLSTAPLVFLVFNRSTQDIQQQMRLRLGACEQLAMSCSLHLGKQDYAAPQALMEQFLKRNPDLAGLSLVRFDGLVIQQLGEPIVSATDEISPAHIRIPIMRGARKWGFLEANYNQDLAQSTLWKIARAFGLTFFLNLTMFGMLLRRSLAVLDSGNAVPRRVKNTLDTIAGGVVILDPQGRIVMANEAFQNSSGHDIDSLVGLQLNSIPFRAPEEVLPWDQAAQQRQRVSGATLFLSHAEHGERCFVVNATPIFDSKDGLAGTLISFEDVTILEQQNQSLMQTLAELETSREQIHQQNIRLQELASMDALTGTFNRRSLFEHLETQWNSFLQDGQAINCIMLDVDHFKKLNDNHGHAAGDQVLRDVSRTIKEAVQDQGLVGRYGGEEFCIVLPNMPVQEAALVGEKVRQAIETGLAEPYAVTASFGVSSSEFEAPSYQAMLEQADLALYAAKHGGRNAVRCWSAELENVEEEVAQPAVAHAEQPISYHAVASLHSALAYRDADTALHCQRVAEMSVALGRGLMTVSELYVLEISAILHDIGKIGVPDAILFKPTKLDPDEWKIMEAHSRMGVEIIESSFDSQMMSDIVRYHHYRFDGQNTPPGEPVGQDLPLGARIVCIADAYDAIVSNRVYRRGRPPEVAFEELRRCAGTQFDPELVERFIALQLGWRLDSRYIHSDVEDKLAITIGHLTERTMTAFEAKDAKILAESLDKLGRIADSYEMPGVRHLAGELSKAIGNCRDNDWEFVVPVLQDLLDLCLAVQRAHIRDVAARPKQTENCPQIEYYDRVWQWEADESAAV